MKTRAMVMLVLAACTNSQPQDPSHPGGTGGKTDDQAATSGHCREMSGAHHDGDRSGLHGMVLFGRANYFLEHIPMFSRPHNEQLVMRVSLKTAQGADVTNDFSDQGYSVRPTTQFSLDDLTLGKRVAFAGNVHRGNFEENGPVILTNVKITVDEVLVARNLPGSEPIAPDEQEYFVVGDADDAYATNFIRDARGFQQILRVDAIEGATPSPSRVLKVRAKATKRLAASPTPAPGVIAKAGADGTRVTLVVGEELWCLKAPDFVARCD
ncbi:MAG: hypothetical protein M4D80_08595 [Myxococcota bacterium]|nr:hypothetical protein [Deltaproteobacteria bacterium]MDQ3335207.1 hypothetical protein [Myxococcota bacterium]